MFEAFQVAGICVLGRQAGPALQPDPIDYQLLCRLSSCRVRGPPLESGSTWAPGHPVTSEHLTKHPAALKWPEVPDWKGRTLSCDFLVDVLYSFIFFFLILCPSAVTNGTSHSPTALNGAPSPPNGFSNGPSSSSSSSLANQQLPPACGARQLSKLKRFLTTLQQFGNDISPEIGERVRTLVLGLVVSQLNAAQLGGREKVGETPSTGCLLAALLFPHLCLSFNS